MAKKILNKTEAAMALGSLGGRANVKAHGKKYMRALGKKGGLTRWKKERKSK